MMLSATLPFKLRIIWSGPFPDVSYSCVVYVYNDCPQTNQSHQSHHSRTVLTSHLFYAYDAFSSFIDSLNMIFYQYRETYEVLRDYPKMEGGNVKDYEKKSIRKLLHANSCVHSRRLIAEFPEDGIKCMEKLQSHCANMTFADKIRYDRTFQQVTHKGGK